MSPRTDHLPAEEHIDVVSIDLGGEGPAAVSGSSVPIRHWRSYGKDPLPTGAEALKEPFNAFPSCFLLVECGRCGKVQLSSTRRT